MMCKFDTGTFDNNKFITTTTVLNLFSIEYYTYTKYDDMVNLTIYMHNNNQIKIKIDEENFNKFEKAIESNIGFFNQKSREKEKKLISNILLNNTGWWKYKTQYGKQLTHSDDCDK